PSHRRPAAVGQAVDDAAAVGGAVFQVFVGLVDNALGNDDAGVPGRPQRLHLGDGDRAFVEAAAVGAGDVAPAAARRLRLTGESDGARQNAFQLLAPFAVFLLAVNLREEEQGEPVAVHVPARLGGVVRVADEAVALAAFHEPIGTFADALGVLAL